MRSSIRCRTATEILSHPAKHQRLLCRAKKEDDQDLSGVQMLRITGGLHAGLRFLKQIRGFPKIRGTILGVPIIRTIIFWGLYWGPLILGNYHMLLAV